MLLELIHWLPKVRPDWQWHLFLFEERLRQFGDPQVAETVTLDRTGCGNTGLERLRWVHTQLGQRVRSIRADMIFSLANIGSSAPCVPQVVFVHHPLPFFSEGMPREKIVQRLRFRFMRNQILRGARNSRGIIVQTNAMRDRIQQLEPGLGERLEVIPSGYRTVCSSVNIRESKKQLIDQATRPRLIYVSAPRIHKNHITLINALPFVLSEFPNVSLLVTEGLPDPYDSSLVTVMKTLTRRIQKLRLDNRVVRLGHLNSDEVDYALRNCDLMVFPSLNESFGLPLAEAIKANCPIVASDLPYAHDVAADGARYFEPNSPHSIAETIISVLSDTSIAQELRKTGSRRKSMFSYEIISDAVARALEHALRSSVR